jgi:hypothetical protein
MAPKLSTTHEDPRIPGRGGGTPLPVPAPEFDLGPGLQPASGSMVGPTGRTSAQGGPNAPWQGEPQSNSRRR